MVDFLPVIYQRQPKIGGVIQTCMLDVVFIEPGLERLHETREAAVTRHFGVIHRLIAFHKIGCYADLLLMSSSAKNLRPPLRGFSEKFYAAQGALTAAD
jgi:hypothetical protein